MRRSTRGRAALSLAAITAVVLPTILAASALAAGPPFPEPIVDQHVYDTAGVLSDVTRSNTESMATGLANGSGANVIVYTQERDASEVTKEQATADAKDLVTQWGADLAIVADVGPDGEPAAIGLATDEAFATTVDAAELAAIETEVDDWLSTGDIDSAIAIAMARSMVEVLNGDDPAGVPTAGVPATEVPDPGPPFPDPVDQQAVYDFAGILSPEAIVDAEKTIDAIEARTGAEVVVYTQLVDYGVTTEETQARALALIDQWGVGRKGFDDGMVIFFDIDPSRRARPGPVVRRARVRGDVPHEQRAPVDLRERHGPVPAQRRLRWCAGGRTGEGRCRRPPRRTRPAARSAARSTPSSGSSAHRSCSWVCRAGRSSTGDGSARIRSISTIRRS